MNLRVQKLLDIREKLMFTGPGRSTVRAIVNSSDFNDM